MENKYFNRINILKFTLYYAVILLLLLGKPIYERAHVKYQRTSCCLLGICIEMVYNIMLSLMTLTMTIFYLTIIYKFI